MIKTETALGLIEEGLMPPEGEYENPGVKVLCDMIRENMEQIAELHMGILRMAEVESNQ